MRIAFVIGGLVVLDGSHGVAALQAGSAPSFAAARLYATGHTPLSVAIGDLNGDCNPDLATANFLRAGTVSVLLNRGDGRFQTKRDYATGRDRRPERGRQPGSGDRERRREHRFRAGQQG